MLPEAQRSVRRENFAIFLFSAGDLVLKIYSFGILRGFLASYVELRILVFLMEAFSKKKVGGVASKSKKKIVW